MNVKLYNQDNRLVFFRNAELGVFKVITDVELFNDNYRLDALNTIGIDLDDITHRQCKDYLTDLYRDLNGTFIDAVGAEIFLDLEPIWEACDEWFRDAIQTSAPKIKPLKIRAENRERLRGIISLYRAYYPSKAMLWGVRPANQNIK